MLLMTDNYSIYAGLPGHLAMPKFSVLSLWSQKEYFFHPCQISTCTSYKNNMADNLSLTKMIWTEILQEQFFEGNIFYLKSTCFRTEQCIDTARNLLQTHFFQFS